MDLLLDVDGDDGDLEVGGVLLIFPFPDELRIERWVPRVEHLRRRRFVRRHEPAQFLRRDIDARVLVLDRINGCRTGCFLRLLRHGDARNVTGYLELEYARRAGST